MNNNCPICATELKNGKCPNCGFKIMDDYLQFRTVSPPSKKETAWRRQFVSKAEKIKTETSAKAENAEREMKSPGQTANSSSKNKKLVFWSNLIWILFIVWLISAVIALVGFILPAPKSELWRMITKICGITFLIGGFIGFVFGK